MNANSVKTMGAMFSAGQVPVRAVPPRASTICVVYHLPLVHKWCARLPTNCA